MTTKIDQSVINDWFIRNLKTKKQNNKKSKLSTTKINKNHTHLLGFEFEWFFFLSSIFIIVGCCCCYCWQRNFFDKYFLWLTRRIVDVFDSTIVVCLFACFFSKFDSFFQLSKEITRILLLLIKTFFNSFYPLNVKIAIPYVSKCHLSVENPMIFLFEFFYQFFLNFIKIFWKKIEYKIGFIILINQSINQSIKTSAKKCNKQL